MATVKERLELARKSLRKAQDEYKIGKESMRQACKRAYQALLEAEDALIQKKGLGAPGDRWDRLEKLKEIKEKQLLDADGKYYQVLHYLCYRGGLCDEEEIERSIDEIADIIDEIEERIKKIVKRRR